MIASDDVFTSFRVQSIKSRVAASITTAISEGDICVDDDVAEWLKSFDLKTDAVC